MQPSLWSEKERKELNRLWLKPRTRAEFINPLCVWQVQPPTEEAARQQGVTRAECIATQIALSSDAHVSRPRPHPARSLADACGDRSALNFHACRQ